jgi:hypothetical protein
VLRRGGERVGLANQQERVVGEEAHHVRARRLDVRDELRARLVRESGRVYSERLARVAEDAPGGVLGVRLVGEEEAARVRRAKPAGRRDRREGRQGVRAASEERAR